MRLRLPRRSDLSVKWAGGGVISTVMDLAHFDIALNAGRLVNRSMVDVMYTSARLNSGAYTATAWDGW